jgi:ADP-ribosylglycohydrolase
MNEIEITLTDHAMKRAKERLKLPRKAVLRLAAKAWAEGLPGEECGILASADNGNIMRVYGQNVFVFSQNMMLVTVRPLAYGPTLSRKQKVHYGR